MKNLIVIVLSTLIFAGNITQAPSAKLTAVPDTTICSIDFDFYYNYF